MPAYLIANIDVTDPTGYEQCKAQAPATIAAYGGRYLTRGGATAVLEGDWAPHRLVILEFPDMARLHAWYDSVEYRPLIEIRQRTSHSSFIAIEGH
jgi:uncharacterized protein (DUF1330 family)